MTDREILAQLKKSYENLQDIRENGCSDICNGQLSPYLIGCLNHVMEELCDIWDGVYDSLDNETISIKKDSIDRNINNLLENDEFNIPIYKKMLHQNQELFKNVYKVRIDKDITGYYELINNDGTSDYVGLDVLCNYEWYDDINYLNENLEKEEDYEIL